MTPMDPAPCCPEYAAVTRRGLFSGAAALLGTTTADASGSWTFTPTTALTDGSHSLTATVTDAAGNLTTRSLYLTPDQVLNGSLDDGPFVFLNACQVGSDKRVLADNGGFA